MVQGACRYFGAPLRVGVLRYRTYAYCLNGLRPAAHFSPAAKKTPLVVIACYFALQRAVAA